MDNLVELEALMTRYGLVTVVPDKAGLAKDIGYTYDGVHAWFRKENERSRVKLSDRTLKYITQTLAVKYPDL